MFISVPINQRDDKSFEYSTIPIASIAHVFPAQSVEGFQSFILFKEPTLDGAQGINSIAKVEDISGGLESRFIVYNV